MGKSKYTFQYNNYIENLIDSSLREIANETLSADVSKHLEYLVLGGGYGRGEGGILLEEGRNPKLFNDLDFFVVSKTNSAEEKKALDDFFKKISKKWEEKLEIEVDFGYPRTVEYIANRLNVMMWKEMALGCAVVVGDKAKFEKDFSSAKSSIIPPREIAKLLSNRIYGLFAAYPKLQESAISHKDSDFISRNINKTLLACVDAILTSKNLYEYSSKNKMLNLQKISADISRIKNLENLPAIYQKSLDFKANPSLTLNKEELQDRFDLAVKIALATTSYLNSYLQQFESIKQIVINTLRNFRHKNFINNLDAKTKIFKSPSLILLKVLVDFFENPKGFSKFKLESMTNFWKSIN